MIAQALIAGRLTADTTRAITRDKPYLLTVAGIALLIPVSAELTLFALGARAQLIREMGLASLLLGGLIVTLFANRYQPGEDLRCGPGPAILATPAHPLAYTLGRLAGLGVALLAATVVWLGVLAATMAVNDAGHTGPAMLAAATLGIAELLVIGAVLQRTSLWLSAAPTAAVGVVLYLLGHTAGLLATGAPPLRMLPNLAAMDLTTPAALGQAIPVVLVATALAYGALYALAFGAWTADALARRGGSVR